MAVLEGHPSIEELAAFTLGTLADDVHASVEAHVAGCTVCQERAAAAPDDTLTELLRCAHARLGGRTEVETPALYAAKCQTVTVGHAAAPPASAEGAPGLVPSDLADHERYHVLRLLGAGGMGTVYEAEHRVMQRPVALKVINRSFVVNAWYIGGYKPLFDGSS
jgi:serine/threonine-protein kinase